MLAIAEGRAFAEPVNDSKHDILIVVASVGKILWGYDQTFAGGARSQGFDCLPLRRGWRGGNSAIWWFGVPTDSSREFGSYGVTLC